MSGINPKHLKYLENVQNAEWAVAHLANAHSAGFYGKITFQLEAGNIVIIRKEQTQKPPKNTRNGGIKNGN